jgi:hypothetical protein
MMAAVSAAPFGPGYCQVCGEPARVGRLVLAGWPHGALVCAACLRRLATHIELSGGTPPTKEEA